MLRVRLTNQPVACACPARVLNPWRGQGCAWPRWRLPLLVFAFAVAASRVILHSHYPADVVGGALVAWMTVTWLTSFLADCNIVFRRDSAGRPVPRFPELDIAPP